jgi:hypothetical protein
MISAAGRKGSQAPPPVGDDIQAEPVVRQFEADGAGQLAVGRLDRTVAEHLAIVGADHGQAVAGGETAGSVARNRPSSDCRAMKAPRSALPRWTGRMMSWEAPAALAVIRRHHVAADAQRLLQGAQADAGQLIADEGGRRIVGRHPLHLAVGIDPDDGVDFRVFAGIARSADLEGFVGQLPEFLLAAEFGQKILMGMQARLDGPLGPVHVAFQCRAGGIQFAPLQQRGQDEHGQCENTDGEIRASHSQVCFGAWWRVVATCRNSWLAAECGHWYLP